MRLELVFTNLLLRAWDPCEMSVRGLEKRQSEIFANCVSRPNLPAFLFC